MALRRGVLLALAMSLCAAALAPVMAKSSAADSVARPSIHAVTVTDAPVIDGQLDESVWQQAEPVTLFTQLDPEEGQASTERTEVRILLGPDALYVGVRLFDRAIRSLQHREGRRDDSTAADAFAVELDPLHDHLHGYRFEVGAQGTLSDAVVSSTGQRDRSWDPIWRARTSIDSLGWIAEIRIPLSQLRFNRNATVWASSSSDSCSGGWNDRISRSRPSGCCRAEG